MAGKADTWTSAEDYVPGSEIAVEARTAVVELGVNPVFPGTETTLCIFVTAVGTRTVLEVRTGAGVPDPWFLDSMSADGVFTLIDSEAEFHQQARRAFAATEVLTQCTRFIAGRVLGILPWMAARGHDMMVLDADIAETPGYLDHAVRISRPGGVIAFVYVLWYDQVAGPARRDGETVACCEIVRFLTDSPDFIPTIFLVGDGLVVAVKR